MKFLFLTCFLFTNFLFHTPIEKQYVKEKNNQGVIIGEGWIKNGVRNGYWKFYDDQHQLSQTGHYINDQKDGYWHEYNQGKLSAEGHFKNNHKTNWWTFYNSSGYRTIKTQFKNGVKNGYSLYYKKSALSMVEEYSRNEKLGSWTSYFKFKRDHPGFSMKDLRG